MPGPVPDHAELAEVERDEDADDVELDQPGDLGVEGQDQDDRHHREEHDAVAVGEPVAAGAERARREAVLGEDRAEDGEAVEGGVRREHEDHPGDRDDEVEPRREVAEHGPGDLGDHGVLVVAVVERAAVVAELLEVVRVDVPQAHLLGEHDDAHDHRDGDDAEEQERGRGVLALGPLEGGHPVADRLDTRQRGAAGRERAGQQEQQAERGQGVDLAGLGVRRDGEPGALDVRQVTDGQPQEPVGAHAEDREHEEVGRDREEGARLADAAQVHGHQQQHHHGGDGGLVPVEPRDRAGGVLRPGRDAHRDGEHVVDEQRARDRHARPPAQVDGRDLVVAPAARVGVDVLAVRRDHGRHHQGDGDRDLPGPRVGAGPREGQHDEDLVGGVGHRRERVAGEDRERDPLGQERLAQLGATELASQQDPLGDVPNSHDRQG